MKISTVQNLFYPIADAIGMDMKIDMKRKQLVGCKTQMVRHLFEDFDVPVPCTVVSGYVSVGDRLSSVVLHVGRDLFLLALYEDRRDGRLMVHTINGKKLGWGKQIAKTGRVSLFSGWKYWSRKRLYEKIAPGILATFVRYTDGLGWELKSEGNAEWVEYVKLRNIKASSAAEDINEVNRKARLAAITGN